MIEDLTFIAQISIKSSVAVLLATVGGIINERSGVLNLGLEGMMLIGALAGFAAGHLTGSPLLAVAAGTMAAVFTSTPQTAARVPRAAEAAAGLRGRVLDVGGKGVGEKAEHRLEQAVRPDKQPVQEIIRGGQRASRADSQHSALEAELRGYADYMETDSFRRAASQLITMASKTPTTILCAERLPEHCHRRLIADYLVLQGLRVIHLIDPGEAREHVLSAEARRESAQLVYDRNATLELNL